MPTHALAGLQSRSTLHNQQRAAQAAAQYQQGLAHLETAIATQEPQHLSAASEALYRALQLNPHSAKAHLGLARLYLFMDHAPRAETHLREALRLNPHDPEAQALWDTIQAQAAASQSLPELEIDCDQLYEETQQKVRACVQRVATTPPIAPQADSAYTAALRDQLKQEQQQRADLHNHLQQIERELDTTALQTQLQAYDAWIHRLETTLQVSTQMLMLKSRIGREQAKVTDLMQQVHANPQGLWERALEDLMDRCDQIADDLDPLDERYDLSSLKPLYNQLVAHIHLLQEQIDERSAR